MPRDVAGNYTLPPGNPVITHDPVESTWANSTMSDVAAALTDSLSRNGNGGMLVPFKFADGVRAGPGMSWVNEPTSGWYRAGLNDFRFSVGAQDVFQINATTVTVSPGKTFIIPSIDSTPIGNTTPSTGKFTSVTTPLVTTSGSVSLGLGVNGNANWNISGATGFLMPAGANDRDIGTAAVPVRTGYFGTSLVSPVFQLSSVQQVVNQGIWYQTNAGQPQMVFTPPAGSTGGFQWNNGGNLVARMTLTDAGVLGVPGSVVTPLVKSAAGAFSFGGNNAVEWLSNGSLVPVDDNIRNFGSPGARIHIGYFAQANLACDHAVTDQIRITDTNAAPFNAWVVGISSGNGENALNFYNVNATKTVFSLYNNLIVSYTPLRIPNVDRGYQGQGPVGNLWLWGPDGSGNFTFTENAVANQLAIDSVTGTLHARGGIAPTFESAELTITAATSNSVAHGLAATPKNFKAIIRCKTAEGGYAVGDELFPTPEDFDTINTYGVQCWANATTIGFNCSAGVRVIHKTTGAIVTLTLANWKAVLRTW